MIRYKCASCRTLLETYEKFSGKLEMCPVCRYVNTVPKSKLKKRQEEINEQEINEILKAGCPLFKEHRPKCPRTAAPACQVECPYFIPKPTYENIHIVEFSKKLEKIDKGFLPHLDNVFGHCPACSCKTILDNIKHRSFVGTCYDRSQPLLSGDLACKIRITGNHCFLERTQCGFGDFPDYITYSCVTIELIASLQYILLNLKPLNYNSLLDPYKFVWRQADITVETLIQDNKYGNLKYEVILQASYSKEEVIQISRIVGGSYIQQLQQLKSLSNKWNLNPNFDFNRADSFLRAR